jgi:plastocyanin domain-containing protein
MRFQERNWVLFLLFFMQGGSLCWAEVSGTVVAFKAVVADDGAQHVSIVGGSYFFKPNRVVVKVGVPVELTLSREEGLITHVFVIHAPESGINVDQSLSTVP